MRKKWLWLTIGVVVLSVVCAAGGSAETVYSDGWEPPRLVDGVWVTSGVSDEVAKEYAARLRQEKADEQARWQQMNVQAQWYSPGSWMFGGQAMGFNPPNFQQEWMQRNPPPEWMEVMDDGMGNIWKGGQIVGRAASSVPRRYIPPYTHADSARPGPRIDGMDIWTYADRMNNNYRWQTGQNQYPPWVFTGR